MTLRLGLVAFGAIGAIGSAGAQTLGPDYSQRSLPGAGGSDAITGGSDLTAEDQKPVACVYQYSHRVARPPLIALVKNGFVAKTRDEKMAFELVGETVAACRAGQGWSPKRQDASLQYFSGRMLVEDALSQGRPHGLTAAILHQLSEQLDPATKAAYDAGQVGGPQLAAGLAGLKAAGLDPAPLADDQRQHLAMLIAQGLWGFHLQAASTASFKKG